MCGIYGCVSKDAYEKVFNGLKLLQYRGYDSCGIAYYNNGINIKKAVGSLNNLEKVTTPTTIAFGHTRWATNGVVNTQNAHPHISYDKRYVLVHNGIINNAEEIKKDLIKEGVSFYSTTDTEVIVNYIAFKSKTEKIEKVLLSLFKTLDGSFSLIVGDDKANLYLIKKFSPLNLLVAEDGIYISSDISSLKDGKLYSLKDNDIIKISNNKVKKLNKENIIFEQHKNVLNSLTLINHKHYMLKEINETPIAIKQTYFSIKNSTNLTIFNNFSKITLIGCGTAYHSCLVGEYLLKQELDKDVETILASNYILKKHINSNHLHIIVSQSGETADCIKVAEKIKQLGGKILVITNEKHSTIAKIADFKIFTNAEKEVAVASTKTYCCQVFVFAYICHVLKDNSYDLNIEEFTQGLYNYISNLNLEKVATKLKDIDKMILIGKDIDYLTILEASLKIREIDYVYTLPMYSGELKHGTLSLIEKGRVVLTLNTDNDQSKLQNAINEIKSRQGEVIDFSAFVPNNIDAHYRPIYSVIPFQLLSYEIAVLNGRNPDMPRNLAKSVTVE